MKGTRRLLGLLIATAVVGLAVVPAARGTIFKRFRVVDPYSSPEEERCGIDLQIEGTFSASGSVRTGKGKLVTAFFEHLNGDYSETWTAANGSFVTVSGNFVYNEVKAVPLGDNLFEFTAYEAGQTFRLYDSEGDLVLRDRGVLRLSAILDTLGDATPGADIVVGFEPSVRGPHPGFETLCPVLVPLLTGP